jgi:hypothetical protein
MFHFRNFAIPKRILVRSIHDDHILSRSFSKLRSKSLYALNGIKKMIAFTPLTTSCIVAAVAPKPGAIFSNFGMACVNYFQLMSGMKESLHQDTAFSTCSNNSNFHVFQFKAQFALRGGAKFLQPAHALAWQRRRPAPAPHLPLPSHQAVPSALPSHPRHSHQTQCAQHRAQSPRRGFLPPLVPYAAHRESRPPRTCGAVHRPVCCPVASPDA